jgi:hypothetical protein
VSRLKVSCNVESFNGGRGIPTPIETRRDPLLSFLLRLAATAFYTDGFRISSATSSITPGRLATRDRWASRITVLRGFAIY